VLFAFFRYYYTENDRKKGEVEGKRRQARDALPEAVYTGGCFAPMGLSMTMGLSP